MEKQQPKTAENPPEWAGDVPRKKLSVPYTWGEMLSWVKNNLFGPSHKFKELTDFISRKSTLNVITPKMQMGFLGDIMGMRKKSLQIGPDVIEFFKDCDYLIGNFEGTIVDKEYKGKKVFMRQPHSEDMLAVLETLFPPERFVLTNANNHSGDYGWSKFNESYEKLKDCGFLMIGRRDEPAILLNQKVNIAACSRWTNQPKPKTKYIMYLDEMDEYLNEKAQFNILTPHWGYEMQLYPNPAQIELGQTLLQKWDLISGHHSHCPQPITSYAINDSNKILAYSLGDFCIGLGIKKYHHGMVFKAQIGPGEKERWEIGDIEWIFTRIHKIDKSTFEVRLADACKFFKDKS